MTLKEICKSITKKEWKQILWFSIAVIIITTMPFIYGYFHTPNGKVQSGLRALTPIDMNVYYSYLEQVKQGRIVFVDLFTSEAQTPLIFNLFWLSVGLVGKILKLNNIITFQLARIFLIPVFVITIYIFISYFFTDKTKRQMALIFILFSSGIGAMLAPILEKFVYESYGYYHWPLDMWVPESITFLTLFHTPHFIASLILIILIFLFVLLSWEKNSPTAKKELGIKLLRGGSASIMDAEPPRNITLKFHYNNLKYEIYAGLCALVLFQFHPFHLPTVFCVLGSYFLFLCFLNQKNIFRKLRPLIILFLFTLPDLIYHLYILQNPIIKQRTLQNVCLTPKWWLVLIGFGFLIPLALMGIYYIFKKTKKTFNNVVWQENSIVMNKYYFLIIWLIVQAALIYSPITFQRRMSEGLHIVLCLLSVIAIFALVNNIKQKTDLNALDKIIFYISNNKILALIIFTILFCFSNMFNVARDIIFYKNNDDLVFYLPIEKKESFDWIKKQTNNNAIFLSLPTIGNFIAGNTGRFVYIGHTTETPLVELKQKSIQWFFDGNNDDEEKIKFVKSNNIDYIYCSDLKQIKNKNGFNPSTKNYLKLVYKNNLVEIYEVL